VNLCTDRRVSFAIRWFAWIGGVLIVGFSSTDAGRRVFESDRNYWIFLGVVFALFMSLRTVAHFVDRRARAIRHQRSARGACPDCGYDLRASKDRCPECGREITQQN
jgi:hypothetical protein